MNRRQRSALSFQRSRARRGDRQACAPAFTLIEVLIVLSLLILLASLAWPAMESQIRASELPESANRIRSMLYMARCQAVMEHRRYRIRFLPEHQQPLIEVEPDPIRRPGEFEWVDSGWATEPMLLADVQVHEVRLGRPAWTKPLSVTSDPEELEHEPGLEDEDEAERLEREAFLRSVPLGDDEEIDENRPMIVFEADGSAEWVTFILARVDPEEELEEETRQLWVVLDGRTGLAYVREKVTEDQLSDPEFYVEREKLELPDQVDVDDLSFDVGGDLGGGRGFSSGGGPTAGGFGDGFGGPLAGGGGTGGVGSAAAVGGGSRGGSRSGSSGSRGSRNEGLSDLNRKLEDSDLSEDEKEQIRQSFEDDQN